MRKDLRACAEIVNSCKELEMPLNEEQHKQFLDLFVIPSDSYEAGVYGYSKGSSTARYKPKSYQYKF